MPHLYTQLKGKLKTHHDAICDWFNTWEDPLTLPLYTSVDIRNAGFKLAVVDTNLFPAGFNNLCQFGLNTAVPTLRATILNRVPHCKSVLIIAEEHTRNTFYLENVHVIQDTIQKAGFKVKTATFLDVQPEECENDNFYMPLKTESGKDLKMYCLHNLIGKFQKGQNEFDLIILNNDLSKGIPDILKSTNIPVYPSMEAGWHSRSKAHHFCEANTLIKAFCKIIDIDPWLLSCDFERANDLSITEDAHREILAEKAEALLKRIQIKYDEYKIKEKPFIFLKADSGTYGMGVMPIETPDDIINLNRKGRNKLTKGKSSVPISNFILQEGVPTFDTIDKNISEVCIYHIHNSFVGGFYRLNSEKTGRENLNSQGMSFKKMCVEPSSECFMNSANKVHTDKELELCGVSPDTALDIYRILGKLSGIAASREVVKLEDRAKNG